MTKDHVKQAQSRIHWQYLNAENLREWINTLPVIAQNEIEDPAQIVVDILDIDNRSGAQLDIIGRIVGIDRPAIPEANLDEVVYLTALGDDPTQLGDSDAQMISLESAVPVDVQDDVYRQLIRAKIVVNTSDATIDGIIDALSFVTNTSDVQINDYQDMTFEVEFGESLDSTQRYVLKNFAVQPRPQGVKLLGFVEEPSMMNLNADGDFQMGDPAHELNEVYI